GKLTLTSSAGSRIAEAQAFFTGPLTTAMRPDELLTEIDVAATPARGFCVDEVARRAGDFALVAVIALVRLDARGRAGDVRLAFGGVAAPRTRGRRAEEALTDREPTSERIAEVAALARDELTPQSDAFASGAYRRHLAGVLARRALVQAFGRAQRMGAPS